MPSPVIVATGTGQVGEGLQNTWGLDEEDEEEEVSDINEQENKKGTVPAEICKRLRYKCLDLPTDVFI